MKTKPILLTEKDFDIEYQNGYIEVTMKNRLAYYVGANILAALELKGGKLVWSMNDELLYWTKPNGNDVLLVYEGETHISDELDNQWSEDVIDMEGVTTMECNYDDGETEFNFDAAKGWIKEGEIDEYLTNTNKELTEFFNRIRKRKKTLLRKIGVTTPTKKQLTEKLVKLVHQTKSNSVGSSYDVVKKCAIFESDLGTNLYVTPMADGKYSVVEESEYGVVSNPMTGKSDLVSVRKWIRDIENEYRTRRSA